MIERIPDVQAITYEGMPHNICDADPDRCAADVLAFLRWRFGRPACKIRGEGVLHGPDDIPRGLAPAPPPVMIGGEIPLIDVSGFLAGTPGAAEKAAAAARWAFENVGFYYLAGHGVPRELIEAQYEAAARFHAMPMDEKLKVRVNEHTIGYMPIAKEAPPNAAAQGKKPSQNEAFFLRRERSADDPNVIAGRRFHVQNQWPPNLPGFREQTLKYMSTMEALCQKLVRLYALALDLPADHFDALLQKSRT